MHRFYLPSIQTELSEIILKGDEARHAINVLRISPGDKIILLNGKGLEVLCECMRVDKKSLTARVINKTLKPEPENKTTLILAIPKGRLIEDIIEKSVELGVSRIIPVKTQRTIPSFDQKEIEKRRLRWQEIAISAIKQCGQPFLPEIDSLTEFSSLIAKKEHYELNLVCALIGERKHPRFYFNEFRKTFNRNPQSVALWIGPEGDFTPQEIEQIISIGAKPITLGQLVLRVETAAICILSTVNYELRWTSETY
ncbi:MAG: 16S rRNA (uracil(1498)-N(3))-methyltransferase [Verrucomicrobiae bacterium]|nr:16S rRNA (uracil(1498)-N(3))-methyltransferase [Verrucomicrobiae bacterium]